ncbi:MAG: DNA repair protein RadA [Candidatus Comchoanobacterales bacterium]
MYQCEQCHQTQSKWSGQCPACQAWNVMVEAPQLTKAKKGSYSGQVSAKPVRISEVSLKEDNIRVKTGSSEFDQVLGGGLVLGSVVLLGGDPGIGKSTLMLQTAAYLLKNNTVLYVSGEESESQIALRAQRTGLALDQCELLINNNVDVICAHANTSQPDVLMIDSIQTMQAHGVDAVPGSVSQVKECAHQLVQLAKTKNITVILVGHVTKEGSLAGPRVLEHMVDTVLYFERNQHNRYRMIRAIKNRFGPVSELGVFAMTATGLKEVTNPSGIWLQQHEQPHAGSVITCVWEGTRAMLIEVQALVTQTHSEHPKRLMVGGDQQRLAMIIAMIQKHLRIKLYEYDVFVNIVGGVKVLETGLDLAIIAAILSSLNDQIVPGSIMVFGEVGLSGEVRPIPYGPERVRTAAKQGLKQVWLAKGNQDKVTACQCTHLKHINQLGSLLKRYQSEGLPQ